ncbi:MAG: corrinoid protein [Clostridiales bacterium]
MTSKEKLLSELSRCVLEMEDEEIAAVAEEYIQCGYDPLEGILKGLVDGMNKAAELYEKEEYFVTELLICSSAMYNGLEVLRPMLPQDSFGNGCKIIIGVVQGDTHDIGKNLVKIMLESAGYEVIDLGRDVPVEQFVKYTKEKEAGIVAMATLMSTSMNNMKKVIDLLGEEGIREKVKVVVGGGPISLGFAKKIGADGYAVNATEAVRLVDQLTGISR